MSRDRQRPGGTDASAGYGAPPQHGNQRQERQTATSTAARPQRQATAGTVRRHGPGTASGAQQGGERMRRPTGLRLVAVTMAALGGLLVLSALTLFDGAGEVPGEVGGAIKLVGFLAGGFGVGHLLAAYGLWTVTSWGRTLTLWLLVGSLLSSLLVVLNGGSAALLGVLLYGGMGWYLHTHAGVYHQLRQSR